MHRAASLFQLSIALAALDLALCGLTFAQTVAPGTAETGQDANRRQQFERLSGYLDSVDANHDGRLDADELRTPRGMVLQRLAARGGLTLTPPADLGQLRSQVQAKLGIAEPQPAGSSEQPDKTAEPAAEASSPSEPPDPAAGASQAPSATAPLVPGFGGEGSAPTVAGFGPPVTKTAAAVEPSAPSAENATAPPPADAKEAARRSRAQARIRSYAESILRQHDRNRNGQLERDEWSTLPADSRAADRNGDGTITLDELTQRLVEYSQSRPSAGTSSAGGSKGAEPARAARHDRPTYRFRTATERLPKGLPDWFARQDANADGQVSMAEYAVSWTDAKAAEFIQLDRNGDGIVTPDEALPAKK